MKLTNVLNSIIEEKDVVSYINITGAEIDGNQTKEKSLRLDVSRVMDGSMRKNIEDYLTNFISGQIVIKFVVDGKTIQISTLKKDDKITFIEVDLNTLSDEEFTGVTRNLNDSKIKFQLEGKNLKISNSSSYTPEQLVTLIINIIKIVVNDGNQ